jgi:hypothetical protein
MFTLDILSSLLKDFYSLDVLTQLTLLDMFDQSINNKSIARFILDDLNLFENVINQLNLRFKKMKFIQKYSENLYFAFLNIMGETSFSTRSK